MSFDHCHYVPCLRWKQGEYQAMLRLKTETKQYITPLIEVPEIGWDFENMDEAKTIDKHLAPFAKRVKEKWGSGLCFVDLNLIDPKKKMVDGMHPLDFVFADLRSKEVLAIPVTGVNRDQSYHRAIRKILSKSGHGLCFRISIEQAAKSDFTSQIDNRLSFYSLGKKAVDFILDLGAPNFVPVDGFCKLIQSIIRRIPQLDSWRSFTLLGTSFPQSMAEITENIQNIHRYEWLLYESLIDCLLRNRIRLPSFGDYVIAHPNILLVDPRITKPSASIRYAIDKKWCIVKGRNVRDYGYKQYHDLCRKLIGLACFFGGDFSAGDKYIEDCAHGTERSGNLTTWRWVGTNHHVEKVVCDISSFFGF